MDWPTIIIATIVAAIFLAIIINGIRNKKKGKSSCGCGCNGCAFSGSCHQNTNSPRLTRVEPVTPDK